MEIIFLTGENENTLDMHVNNELKKRAGGGGVREKVVAGVKKVVADV